MRVLSASEKTPRNHAGLVTLVSSKHRMWCCAPPEWRGQEFISAIIIHMPLQKNMFLPLLVYPWNCKLGLGDSDVLNKGGYFMRL